MVAPAALSIVTTSFPEGRARTLVLGSYGAMASAGFVAGLLLGGVLVDTVGCRGVFYVNVPLCLIGAAIGLGVLGAGAHPSPRRHLDVVGACVVTGRPRDPRVRTDRRCGQRVDVAFLLRRLAYERRASRRVRRARAAQRPSHSCRCRSFGPKHSPPATACPCWPEHGPRQGSPAQPLGDRCFGPVPRLSTGWSRCSPRTARRKRPSTRPCSPVAWLTTSSFRTAPHRDGRSEDRRRSSCTPGVYDRRDATWVITANQIARPSADPRSAGIGEEQA